MLRVETRLFLREPGALFWVLAFPSLLLLGFGLVPTYRGIIGVFVPSTVLVALVTASLLALPSTLTSYRERGILRRLRTTPARPAHLLAVQLLIHGTAAVVGALLAVLIGRLVWGVALPDHPVAYGVALTLATLAALATGAVVTAVARTVKAAQAIGLAVFFPAMFAAGIYVPVQALPAAVRRAVELVPFGAAARALDAAAAGDLPSWTHLAVLALWTVVLVGVAARWFRWE
ncbi:ABC transporter permease [Saccharothrix violaceirubra]|uniref:Transport permease protein n=1 Tax=Saccharothrix violaceirubra TaxID=413306 RepID=A0A7W7T0R7_9PSEU|nr:ABC transporter permease [Saccharothrix violaceirubra]MBB4964479.1 ABC-2 type transport system permease protein [Saccharothrix violaceirubra]